MLWTVSHLWPSGAHFLNFYRCWSSLVLRKGNETEIFLHNREDATHGDPLYMVTYGIGVLLMIKYPKSAYTDVTQPWYSYDAGEIGTFDNIQLYFNSLKRF